MPTSLRTRLHYSEKDRNRPSIIKRLDKFKTADGIARFLEKQGYKGHQGRPSTCPIAMYIKDNLENKIFRFVSVSSNICFVNNSDEWIVCETTEAELEFIRKFDMGAYPKLLKSLLH